MLFHRVVTEYKTYESNFTIWILKDCYVILFLVRWMFHREQSQIFHWSSLQLHLRGTLGTDADHNCRSIHKLKGLFHHTHQSRLSSSTVISRAVFRAIASPGILGQACFRLTWPVSYSGALKQLLSWDRGGLLPQATHGKHNCLH